VHIGVVFIGSMLYFAGVDVPLGVVWPIWGLVNLLLVPVTYQKVFQTSEVAHVKCPKCGSLMETKRVQCTNKGCGWVFGEPGSTTEKDA
jgi:uncharacterized C2H2 Zn-finger protein